MITREIYTASHSEPREVSPAISHRMLILVAILFLTAVTRFAGILEFPPQPRELATAIAALPALFQIAGDATGASPFLAILYRLLSPLFGAEIDSLRIPMAMAGMMLICSPLLFRKLLGNAQCLVLCGLFFLSPTMLLASRFAEGALLSQIGCLGLLFALYRCWQLEPVSRERYLWQLSAAFLLALSVFLTDGRGYLLAGSAILAAYLAGNRRIRFNSEVRNFLLDWPWLPSLTVIFGSVLLLATGWLTQWDGLAFVGDNLAAAIAGWLKPGNFLGVIRVSLFYEYGFWLLAVYALILRWKNGERTFVDRFAFTWFVLLALLLTLDRGANPSHASWLSMPLALGVLVGFRQWSRDMLSLVNQKAYWWVAVACILLFVWLGVQLRIFSANGDGLSNISNFLFGKSYDFTWLAFSTVLRLLVGVLLLFILYLGAQMYFDGKLVRHALGTTVVCLLLLLTASNGWRAIQRSDEASRAPWLPQLNTNANLYFAQTLETIAAEYGGQSGDFTIALVWKGDSNPAQRNTLLWHLRAAANITVFPTLESAAGFSIIISDASTAGGEQPALAGEYLGQQFLLTRPSDVDSSTLGSGNHSLEIILWVSAALLDSDYELD